MKKANSLDQIREVAQNLVGYIGTPGGVIVEEEGENILVDIKTEQAPIFIGRHGETISAFQNILSQIAYKLTGESQRIIVDCGGWRAKQEEMLKSLALNTAGEAVQTGQPQHLFNLRSDERRIVHLALSGHPDVSAESQGEGKDRHIIVSPRTSR